MNTLTPKERMLIPRQIMPAQDPQERVKNFDEVNLGYTEELAQKEAARCLDCKKQNCVTGCPVNVDIPGFIEKIVDGEYLEAAAIIKKDNILPAVCSRVCPQEDQCEGVCVLAKQGKPVAIGRLARFVIDYENEHGEVKPPKIAKKTGKKIAIVGSGPAGLSCAGDLIKSGHDVTIFEALHEAGGVLSYGIPEFRLPKGIVKREVAQLEKMGVEFQMNTVIGMTETIGELFDHGYDAVFIGVGAGLPYFLNIPGEDKIGVYSANEFLTRVNLMKAYRFPYFDTPVYDCENCTVAVIGGGNTAMDSVRTAIRLGAKTAYIIYRRTEDELPARIEEIHHAKEEGVRFMFLASPVEFIGDKLGWLKAVRLQEMELGEPDESGRRRPVPVEGKQFVLDVDMAVVAVGNGSNPIIQKTTPDMAFNRWGNIIVDAETMQTSMPGVYAGGDIVTGGATVILAMGAGRKAARAINEYLR
jgi:glutamate synthase (NADPH/NADH) small chain